MSTEDFQARLQRIGASAGQPAQDVAAVSQTTPAAPRKPNLALVGAGGGLVGLGTHLLRKANDGYEAVRDTLGFWGVSNIVFLGAALTLLGAIMIVKGAPRRKASDQTGADPAPGEKARPPSATARFVFSMLGLLLGGIACTYMFMAAAARFVETEAAQMFAGGGVLIATFLAAVSVILGIVGLFIRGSQLVRVPVYFFIGGALTFAAFRLLWINPLEWQEFTAYLQ